MNKAIKRLFLVTLCIGSALQAGQVVRPAVQGQKPTVAKPVGKPAGAGLKTPVVIPQAAKPVVSKKMVIAAPQKKPAVARPVVVEEVEPEIEEGLEEEVVVAPAKSTVAKRPKAPSFTQKLAKKAKRGAQEAKAYVAADILPMPTMSSQEVASLEEKDRELWDLYTGRYDDFKTQYTGFVDEIRDAQEELVEAGPLDTVALHARIKSKNFAKRSLIRDMNSLVSKMTDFKDRMLAKNLIEGSTVSKRNRIEASVSSAAFKQQLAFIKKLGLEGYSKPKKSQIEQLQAFDTKLSGLYGDIKKVFNQVKKEDQSNQVFSWSIKIKQTIDQVYDQLVFAVERLKSLEVKNVSYKKSEKAKADLEAFLAEQGTVSVSAKSSATPVVQEEVAALLISED